MCVVRPMKGHWVRIALLTAIVAVLGLEAVEAVASPVRRGATYEGDGRPPHFSKRTFLLEFRVARDGGRLTPLNVWNLAAACGPVSHYYPSFGFGSAQIRRDGTFKAEMRDYTRDVRGIPVTVTGRFLSNGRARGTLQHRGRVARKGCNADGVWAAHVKGPPPPVQHFTGAALHRDHRHGNPRDLPAHDRTPSARHTFQLRFPSHKLRLHRDGHDRR